MLILSNQNQLTDVYMGVRGYRHSYISKVNDIIFLLVYTLTLDNRLKHYEYKSNH